MAKDNVIDLKKPESFTDDPITDILRQGARRLLATALETEINLFLNQYKEITDAKGNQRVVRNGYLPEREVQTGIGQVPVKMPRIRDQQPSFHPQMVFLPNLGVNRRVCLCDVASYVSAQTLDFLDLGQKSSFLDWKHY